MKEVKINFHYLNQCDMHCYHCFDRINKVKFNKNQVIDTFKLLCNITKAINLVGGEVFTDIPLLTELVKIGTKNNVMLSIVSNGYILLNNLSDENCKYILRNIKMLGISIDSFDDETNQLIGREVDGKALSISKLEKLKQFCTRYNTKLKINTVITQNNIKENLSKNIIRFKPNIWKILQVSTDNVDLEVSNEEFKEFLDCNKLELETKIEYSSNIRSSYVMVNAEGQLYFDGAFTNINVNDEIEEKKLNPFTFYAKLKSNNIDLVNYFSRYSTEGNIKFNKTDYHRKFKKKISNKGNILFLDVESFTPRPSESRDMLKYTRTQIHLLYCGLVVNQDKEILLTFSDYIDYNNDIRKCIDKTWKHSKIFEQFYSDFIKKLKENKINTIIVSGLDTETNFLLDAIYYVKNLNRKDFEYIEREFNHLLDIQLIGKSDILLSDTKKLASRNINDNLHAFRSDIFVHQREGKKDLESSHKVSLDLESIYFRPNLEIDRNKKIDEIRKHCFSDIFDDFELFYSYELLSKSSIKYD